LERTQDILAEFEEKYQIREAIQNQESQVIGTSGTVTVIGAVHLNLPRYNRSEVDDLGEILEETESEKKRYTEREAESFLTRLIYNEIKKEV
jgi:exopolyphosphatase/guanosine-5'-triphosphate,3'-diphosphate pyrophosphatase